MTETNIDTSQHTGGDKEKVHAWSVWASKHLGAFRVLKKAGIIGKEEAGSYRNVAEHLLVVNASTNLLAKKLIEAGIPVDTRLVDLASILHDVGKRREKELGISYEMEQKSGILEDILTKSGYSGSIIETARYTGRVEDIYLGDREQDQAINSRPIESLMVAYADARVRNVDVVPLEVARDKNIEKIPQDVDFYNSWYKFYSKVERRIFSLTKDFKPEELSSDNVIEMVKQESKK